MSEQRLMEKGDLAMAGVTHIEESRRSLSQTLEFHFGQARHQMYKPEVQRRLQKSKESPQVPSTQRAVKIQVWVGEHKEIQGKAAERKTNAETVRWPTRDPRDCLGVPRRTHSSLWQIQGKELRSKQSITFKTAHKSLTRDYSQTWLPRPELAAIHTDNA